MDGDGDVAGFASLARTWRTGVPVSSWRRMSERLALQTSETRGPDSVRSPEDGFVADVEAFAVGVGCLATGWMSRLVGAVRSVRASSMPSPRRAPLARLAVFGGLQPQGRVHLHVTLVGGPAKQALDGD